MPTPLFLDSILLLGKMSSLPFFPFYYALDCNTFQFTLQKPPKHSYLFSIANNILIVTFVVLPILNAACLASYAFQNKSGILIFVNIVIAMFSLIAVQCNIYTISGGQYIAAFTNGILRFHKVMNGCAVTNTTPKCTFDFLKQLFSSANRELFKLVRFDKSVDILGLVYFSNVINMPIITFMCFPCAVYLNLDPLAPLCHFLLTCVKLPPILSIMLMFIRLLIIVISAFFCYRTNCFFVGWLLLTTSIFKQSIVNLRERAKSGAHFLTAKFVYRKYVQLILLHKFTDWFLPGCTALSFGIMFMILVLLCSFSVVGWKIVGFGLYFLQLPNLIVVVSFTSKALDIFVRIYEDTQKLVKYELHFNIWRRLKNKHIFITSGLMKNIQLLQPIVFKCSYIIFADKYMRRNYYGIIIMYTANCLLLIQSNMTCLGV